MVLWIVKVDASETFAQFQPINLCNISYKAMTKILSNRMENVLPYLISANQCRFILGHQLHDNMVILQEVVHSMQNKRLDPG